MEGETGAGAVPESFGRKGRHRVRKASCGPDDRDRSVPHAVELVKAAGLESTRHKEKVASRLDKMGETVVKGEEEPAFKAGA